MKVLVTGSNGLLGQKLVKLLLESGENVIASGLNHNRINYLSQRFDYVELDITDSVQVDTVLKNNLPDIVINTAAMTNVDQCEDEQAACVKLNVDAVENLVHACEKIDAFFIHLSTDFIFDGEAGPYREEDTANPISFYGQSKLDAEKFVKNSRCRWAIIRTVLVFGITPGMSRSNIILWVKESLENGKQLKIVDDQWRTPTLAEDLAMGCYLVAKNNAEGVFNVSGEQMLTPFEMAMKTVDFFNLDASLITKADSSTFSQTAKRPAKTGFILDKAKTKLGYQPHTFEEGIKILDAQVKALDSNS